MAIDATDMDVHPVVFLLDDDAPFLDAMSRNLRLRGFNVRPFASAAEYLSADDGKAPGCLVIDLLLPQLDGLQVQQELNRRGTDRPVVFLSAQGSVATTVQAMQAGAMTFLCKPVSPEELAAALHVALKADASARAQWRRIRRFEDQLGTLTTQERRVLDLLTQGMLNKEIAACLGIAEKTVKMHRGSMTHKFGARTAAGLMGVLLQNDYFGRHVRPRESVGQELQT